MVGLEPPGGCHLQFVAVDLGRGPTGEWFVLADHLRAPAGRGYALENRLALARTLGGLQDRLNISVTPPSSRRSATGWRPCADAPIRGSGC